MTELITKVKRIIVKKETITGDYYVRLRASNNIIVHGFIYDTPETVDDQEIVFMGEWEELSANQEKVFKFNSYQLRDSMKYFFNKTIKIPMKTLNDILKEMSIQELQEVLDECPSELLEFKGVGKKSIAKIEAYWKVHKHDTALFNKLIPFGFSSTLITSIRQALGTPERIVKLIEEDPYQLIQVDGVSFNKVDKIVQYNDNIPLSFKSRIIEGVKYASNQYMNNTGNTIIDYYELFTIAKAILSNDGTASNKDPYYLHEIDFINSINPDISDDFILFNNDLTLKSVYEKELYIYEVLSEMGSNKLDPLINNIDSWLDDKESIGEFKLSIEQRNIIKSANEQYSIFSLSGYAGTGKTMVSRLVMELYDEHHKSIHCCALSGVAANRIKIVSGFDSKTIHAILGFDGITYSFNEKNLLPYDLVVIDETGMVNTEMFYHLLKAINWNRTKLFIIGDPAQLLPVGLGNVYQDILNLDIVHNTTLDKVFRQKDGSIINIVAQHIRVHEFPEKFYNHNSLGFHTKFTPWVDSKEDRLERNINEIMNTLKLNSLKSYTKDNLLDLQIITPTRTSDIGSNKLNALAQQILNPKGEFLEVKGIKYKIGDKVIHLRNIVMDIYQNGIKIKADKVYNGQIGIVTEVDKDNIWVKFPYEKIDINYEYDILKENYLGLAYVLTAHKCQGNEFKDVIMSVTHTDSYMINANYLYSAMTRAKENLYIVGDLGAMKRGISKANKRERKTILKNIK